jgi:hypothetical protein
MGIRIFMLCITAHGTASAEEPSADPNGKWTGVVARSDTGQDLIVHFGGI